MCLIITLFAAVISSIFWFFSNPQKELQLGMLSLMYWGAGLMWLVDCVASLLEGEGFLELSLNDAILGLIVVLCGLIVWFLSLLLRNPQRLFAHLSK